MRKLKRKWGKTERELSSNIAINPTDNLIEKNAYFNFAPLLLLRKGGGGWGANFRYSVVHRIVYRKIVFYCY